MPITLNTINFNNSAMFGTGQLDGVKINSSGNLELDQPGEFPYIEFTCTNNTGGSLTDGVVTITIDADMLSDLLVEDNDIEIPEFAVVDDTGSVLYYWLVRSGTPLTESDKLSIDDVLHIKFKKKTTGASVTIDSGSSETAKLRRYMTVNNMASGEEPSATASFDVAEEYTTYHPSGTWTSPVLDLTEQPIDAHFSWVENIASGSGARIDVDELDPQVIEYRVSNSNTGLSSAGGTTVISDSDGNPVTYYMVEGDWGGLTESDWELISENTSVPETGRYVQFRVTLMI
jgi:hypothetical protein